MFVFRAKQGDLAADSDLRGADPGKIETSLDFMPLRRAHGGPYGSRTRLFRLKI